MTVRVRIVFAAGAADWLVDESTWVRSPDSVPGAMQHAVTNISEWESFWLRPVAGQSEVDARDLNFDGNPVQSADWSYRGRRWIALRGRNPPVNRVPARYSVLRFEEGWVLFDDILDRNMFLVCTGA